jgi:hypothetical protein
MSGFESVRFSNGENKMAAIAIQKPDTFIEPVRFLNGPTKLLKRL